MRRCWGCRARGRGDAKSRAGRPGDSGRAALEHLTIVGADAPDALHGTAPFSRGDAMALRLPKDAYHLFDQNGQVMTA